MLFGTVVAFVIVIKAYVWLVTDWTFGAWLVLVAAAVATVALSVVSAALTWRDSRLRERPTPAWSRWYAVVPAALLLIAINAAPPEIAASIRNFSIPSESMLPSLRVGDRLVAQRRHLGPLATGQVFVLATRDGEVRIGRLVATAGQSVALRSGRVIIDGQPVSTQPTADAMVWREQLPGEAGSHLIRDEGVTLGDEFGPVTVPPGHLFILGDNRDRSADSRFPVEDFGIGMVAESAVLGRARFLYWSHDRSRIGRVL